MDIAIAINTAIEHVPKTERAAYDAISKNPLATAQMIAQTIGKSEKTIYRAIKRLKKLNFIVREGND